MSDTRIVSIKGRQVWDSRGRPTVETEVTLTSGAVGRAIAPSGASTGTREALDLRDGGKRLGGFGVDKALASIARTIAPRLAGMDAADQKAVDRAMIEADGSPQKSNLGGNAIVAVSQATAWAAATAHDVPLWKHLRLLAGLPEDECHVPVPMIQIFGGGAHAGGRVDIQDFLVIPKRAARFAEATEQVAEVYLAASALMRERGAMAGICDEGGLWPDFERNEDVLEALIRAIELAGFRPGEDIAIALDVAASELGKNGRYTLALEQKSLDTAQFIDLLERWCAAHPIQSLEDPVGEDDDDGFVEVTRRLGDRCAIVGDDYLVTDAALIAAAAKRGACNAALLKVNQCGTVSELIAATAAARDAGWRTVMSGRSGESEDVSLSHLAVGLMATQIKVGSIARSERTAKWNEVIRIEESFD